MFMGSRMFPTPFTCYSGQAVSGVERDSIAGVTHQSRPVSATRCKVVAGGGKSGKVGAFQEEFSKSRAGSEK